jgi:hypothetical protein
VADREVFGTLQQGSVAEPAVRARSVHHVMKVVAGTPLRRPPWFFDIDEYGEGLADVGTHVVDLVQWTAFLGGALIAAKKSQSRRAPLAAQDDKRAVHAGHWRRRISTGAGETCTWGVLDYFAITGRTPSAESTPQLEIPWNWRRWKARLVRGQFPRHESRVEIRQGKGGALRP